MTDTASTPPAQPGLQSLSKSFEPAALEALAFQACKDVSHLLRPAHLAQLAASIKTNRSLAERLPKDFGIADEPAHVYRLPLPKGGQ